MDSKALLLWGTYIRMNSYVYNFLIKLLFDNIAFKQLQYNIKII